MTRFSVRRRSNNQCSPVADSAARCPDQRTFCEHPKRLIFPSCLSCSQVAPWFPSPCCIFLSDVCDSDQGDDDDDGCKAVRRRYRPAPTQVRPSSQNPAKVDGAITTTPIALENMHLASTFPGGAGPYLGVADTNARLSSLPRPFIPRRTRKASGRI